MNGRQRGRAHHEAVRPGGTNTPEERRRGDQADADAERDHDQVAFRVIAVLECVVPPIEHLHDWRADANGEQKCGKEPARRHETNDNTVTDMWFGR